jgi:hypothetical protein
MGSEKKSVKDIIQHLVCRKLGNKHVIGKDPGWLPEIEASSLLSMIQIVSALIHHLLLGMAAQPIIINAINIMVGTLSQTGTELSGHHGRISS